MHCSSDFQAWVAMDQPGELRLRFAEPAGRVECFLSELTNGMAAPGCQGYRRRGLRDRGGVWAGFRQVGSGEEGGAWSPWLLSGRALAAGSDPGGAS